MMLARLEQFLKEAIGLHVETIGSSVIGRVIKTFGRSLIGS